MKSEIWVKLEFSGFEYILKGDLKLIGAIFCLYTFIVYRNSFLKGWKLKNLIQSFLPREFKKSRKSPLNTNPKSFNSMLSNFLILIFLFLYFNLSAHRDDSNQSLPHQLINFSTRNRKFQSVFSGALKN